MIKIEGLRKSFGQQEVLCGIDLEIRDGELVSLLGPSGCGKSTFLRILAGFETADAGRVFMEGEELLTRPLQKRKIAMVFQNYALFPHMSVEENIAYALRQRKVSAEDIAGRLDQLLSLTQLSHLRRKNVGYLSGGEQQRTAFARALAADPELLLLDEPLSNIDARLREEMREEIHRLHKETGVTSIYVTHDQSEALYLSDRVVLLNQGKIEQEGLPADIYNHPISLYAADFVGSNNILRIPELLKAFAPAAALAIRPENIKILDKSDDQADVRGKIVSRFFCGASMRYRFDLGPAQITVECPNRTDQRHHEPGEEFGLCFERSAINAYNEEGRLIHVQA